MSTSSIQKPPFLFLFAALAFALAHLVFEDITGGIQSHHLLADPELPKISNWWGLLTLPLLGLVFGIRIQRLAPKSGWADFPQDIWMAFIGALAYGALLAISFENGLEMLTNITFFGLVLWALVFPIYRVEYLLGFVMGMTFTFGGVLPLLIASVFAAISAVVRGGVWVVRRLRRLKKG